MTFLKNIKGEFHLQKKVNSVILPMSYGNVKITNAINGKHQGINCNIGGDIAQLRLKHSIMTFLSACYSYERLTKKQQTASSS